MSRQWIVYGCGYVGERLARQLARSGERVRVASRNPQRLAPLGELGVEIFQSDVTRARSLLPVFHGVAEPVIVYSVPPVALPVGEAIRRVGEAAMRTRAQRFIYLGSTAVYGTPAEEGAWVDEDTPVAVGDPEAQPRIAEEAAVELLGIGGLSTVVLRLAAIYGPGRGVRERLRAGTYQLIDDGRHYYSRIHVDDLVTFIRAAAERAPSRAVYNIADERPTTQREYCEWLCARLGVPMPPSVPSLAPGRPRRPIRNRRISSGRARTELAVTLAYPSFVEGEVAIEAEERGELQAE